MGIRFKWILCTLATALVCIYAPDQVALAAAAAGVFASGVMGGRLARRLAACTERLSRMAKGDFHGPAVPAGPDDEAGRLAEAVRGLSADLTRMTRSAARLLDAAAENRARAAEKDFPGDFARLGQSAERAASLLEERARQIGEEAGRSAGEALQTAAGARALCRSADRQSEAAGKLAQASARLTSRLQKAPKEDAEAAAAIARDAAHVAGMARAHATAAERFAVRTERLGARTCPDGENGPHPLSGTSITYTIERKI